MATFIPPFLSSPFFLPRHPHPQSVKVSCVTKRFAKFASLSHPHPLLCFTYQTFKCQFNNCIAPPPFKRTSATVPFNFTSAHPPNPHSKPLQSLSNRIEELRANSFDKAAERIVRPVKIITSYVRFSKIKQKNQHYKPQPYTRNFTRDYYYFSFIVPFLMMVLYYFACLVFFSFSNSLQLSLSGALLFLSHPEPSPKQPAKLY